MNEAQIGNKLILPAVGAPGIPVGVVLAAKVDDGVVVNLVPLQGIS